MSRMGTRWHPRYTDVLKPWCNTMADDVSRCRRERNDHEGSAASHRPRSGQSGASDDPGGKRYGYLTEIEKRGRPSTDCRAVTRRESAQHAARLRGVDVA